MNKYRTLSHKQKNIFFNSHRKKTKRCEIILIIFVWETPDMQNINQYNSEGDKSGYWQEYWCNGNLWFKGHYINGKENGLCEFYYDNGQLATRRNFVNGKERGLCLFYNKDGQLINKELYIN